MPTWTKTGSDQVRTICFWGAILDLLKVSDCERGIITRPDHDRALADGVRIPGSNGVDVDIDQARHDRTLKSPCSRLSRLDPPCRFSRDRSSVRQVAGVAVMARRERDRSVLDNSNHTSG